MKIAKGILWIIITLLAVILIYQNIGALLTPIAFRAQLKVVNPEFSVPVYGIILFFIFVGVVAMAIFSIVDHYKMKRDISAIKRAIKEKDKELSSLRNLPITSTELPGYKENGK